jgi:hypothetical protein
VPKTSKSQISIRKAPRLIPFVATAGVIGLAFTLILAWTIQAPANFFGVVVAYGTGAFMAVGLIIVLILDAVSQARAKTLEATKLEG